MLSEEKKISMLVYVIESADEDEGKMKFKIKVL